MALSEMEMIMMLIGAGQGASNSVQAAGAGKRAAQQSAQQIKESRDSRNQAVALKESTENPFRQQLDQARSIGSLDVMERASYAPTKITPAAGYSVPQMSGGFNYTKSPEMIASAAALKKNVMGGNTAPTMTDPTNYGKSATLDLVSLANQGGDPSRVNAAGQRPTDPNSYLANADRRMAGKAFSAETRGTDIDANQARQILDRVYRTEFGRAPAPGEIDQALFGQGLQAGGRFVGESGILGIINAWRSQATPSVSYAGRG